MKTAMVPFTGRTIRNWAGFNDINPAVDKFASWTPYNFESNDLVEMNNLLGLWFRMLLKIYPQVL
ncbi:hypothetical protein DIU36_18140 [Mucilaginibacter rubeus]|nr:hypothetical protein DIU36_18140 [Mucilaginibacter rubeus]